MTSGSQAIEVQDQEEVLQKVYLFVQSQPCDYLGMISGSQILEVKDQEEDTGQQTTGAHQWLVIALCALGQSVTLGASLIYSVHLPSVMEEFKISYSKASLLFALANAFLRLSGPLATLFIDHFGYRKATLIAGVGAGICQFIAAWMPTYFLVVLFWGILSAMFLCIGLSTLTLVPSFYLQSKDQDFAFAVIFAGSSLGTAIQPLIYEYSIEHYGWRGSLIIISALSLNLLIPASILPEPGKEIERIQSKQQTLKNLHFDVFNDPRSYFAVIASFMLEFVSVGFLVFLFDMLVEKYRFTDSEATIVITAYGLATLPGRFFVVLLRRAKVPRYWLCSWIGLVCSIMYLASSITPLESAWVAVGFILLVAMLTGLLYTSQPVVLSDLFDSESLVAVLGFCNFFMGLGSLLGPLFIGTTLDACNGNFSVPTVFLAGGMGLISLFGVLIYPVTRRCNVKVPSKPSISIRPLIDDKH